MREFELYCFVSNSNNNLEFRLINNQSKMAIDCDCESVEDIYYALENIKGRKFSYSGNTVHDGMVYLSEGSKEADESFLLEKIQEHKTKKGKKNENLL